MSKLHQEVVKLYAELEVLLAEFRTERAKEEPTHVDSYWQGKKDGVRIAMNLIHPLTLGDDGIDAVVRAPSTDNWPSKDSKST